jgi:cytochrome c oxidase assembly protein subunit 15
MQLLLGVLAVLSSLKIVPNQWGPFEWLAQLHQLVAMLLLLSLVWVLYVLKRR